MEIQSLLSLLVFKPITEILRGCAYILLFVASGNWKNKGRDRIPHLHVTTISVGEDQEILL